MLCRASGTGWSNANFQCRWRGTMHKRRATIAPMLRRRTGVLIAIAAGVFVMLLLAFDVVDPLELPARDLILRRLPQHAAQRTVVVAIDEQSLRTIGAWPW